MPRGGFIGDPSVIRDLLNHLGLWLASARPPPKAHALPIRKYAAVDLQLHIHAETLYGDPGYTWDEDIQSSHIVKKGSRFDNTKGTHRDKAKRTHPCWVVVGPVGGTFYRPVAFLPFDTLRLSHRNLSPEDRPATTIAVTTLSSSVWSRPSASIHRTRIRQ